jgi:hypothetical protein
MWLSLFAPRLPLPPLKKAALPLAVDPLPVILFVIQHLDARLIMEVRPVISNRNSFFQ